MHLDNMFRRVHYARRRNLILLTLSVWLPIITQLLLPQYTKCVWYTCVIFSCIILITDFIKYKFD